VAVAGGLVLGARRRRKSQSAPPRRTADEPGAT